MNVDYTSLLKYESLIDAISKGVADGLMGQLVSFEVEADRVRLEQRVTPD